MVQSKAELLFFKKIMKGIILAGGSGTRLYPLTIAISKQLLPVYDKPAIYYPISSLMSIGIREIMIISTSRDLEFMKSLLLDGSQFGCSFSYAIQEEPNGIAQAFIIAEEFIENDSISLILGDNIFFGNDIEIMSKTINENEATVFAYQVSDPQRYGVVNFDENMIATDIQEKPEYPKSNYAVTGWYFYSNDVVKISKSLKPSLRGELEITDVNKIYLEQNKLNVKKLSKGTAWLDIGTFESLMQASQFVQTVETRQGIKIGCLEEIAFQKGFIDSIQLEILAQKYLKSGYGDYLLKLLK